MLVSLSNKPYTNLHFTLNQLIAQPCALELLENTILPQFPTGKLLFIWSCVGASCKEKSPT
jgi:hypothetical protein